ncbi:41873_t:CDS:2 [Gigaspora margarita]|uniref:41873_t:CDS:1 n=1 Tax=Gigaspora margarita TaxID=4874 RepID=A0ABN7UB76_GIGMA|nr:41873_t:CDS:2 [Gigaspora margarita]
MFIIIFHIKGSIEDPKKFTICLEDYKRKRQANGGASVNTDGPADTATAAKAEP